MESSSSAFALESFVFSFVSFPLLTCENKLFSEGCDSLITLLARLKSSWPLITASSFFILALFFSFSILRFLCFKPPTVVDSTFLTFSPPVIMLFPPIGIREEGCIESGSDSPARSFVPTPVAIRNKDIPPDLLWT